MVPSMRLALICAVFTATGANAQDKALTPEIGEERLQELAQGARIKAAEMTFDEFKESSFVFKEPFEGGKFIVNGDTPISSEEELREFFELLIEQALEVLPAGRLTLVPGDDGIWSDTEKKKLTYCVSDSFEGRKAEVADAMKLATAAWEKFADIDYVYDASQDKNCDHNNERVKFDIRPVDFGGYLARAFFPNDARAQRNILIDGSAFEVTGNLTLTGILRHELGHTIGLRHEHTRPEAGTCFEDLDWIGVTDYDPFSVMHYPQCNGLGDWSLTLSYLDRHGMACVYGAANGFTPDPDICEQVGGILDAN